MAKSNAVKRLERILFDPSPEEYGPKLTRLNRQDEQYILDLVERKANPQFTRREILRLDEARRTRVRERRTSKTSSAPKRIDIEQLRRDAYSNMRRQLGGKPQQIAHGVKVMTNDELQLGATGSETTLKAKASIQAPWVYAPDLGYDINPFWYN